jgi:DNA-binding MarR family transcriptional regulator
MNDNTKALVAIVRTVPLLFHRLRAIGDALHAGQGITTPMRGVMRSLYEDGPATVPQLAAARPVSRQHIQTQVDALADRSLVRSVPNPAHKRSSLISLTDSGRQLFETMQKKESEVLAGLIAEFSPSELKTTEQTLARLAEHLSYLMEDVKETKNDD